MLILQILSLLFFALAVPVGMGAGVAAFVERQEKNICFIWMSGQLLSMALFQIVTVPVILLQEKWDLLNYGAFSVAVLLFGCPAVLAAVAGSVIWFKKWGRHKTLRLVKNNPGRAEKLLWPAVGVILLIQLFLAAFLAFSDGDDAYYLAVASVTESGESMYMVLPYTGGTTGLDTRHCLAPFPVWIAFLARVSGFHTAIVAQIAIPILFIPLTYAVYGMIGNRLLKEKRGQLAVFMIFTELLVLWGNYSLYTAETFLMTRSRQGKAALGNLIIPALFLLLYLMGERIAENKRIEKGLWILLFALVAASCLCSTLGGFLVAVLLGLFWVCIIAAFRKWRMLLPSLICLLPAVCYIGLYMLLQ